MTRYKRGVAGWARIMKEGPLVMERTREELQYEDLVKIYIDYMKSEPLKM